VTTDRGRGRRDGRRAACSAADDGPGERRAGTALGTLLGHRVLGLVRALLALLEVVLHLAVLGQVDRRYLLLRARQSNGSRKPPSNLASV